MYNYCIKWLERGLAHAFISIGSISSSYTRQAFIEGLVSHWVYNKNINHYLPTCPLSGPALMLIRVLALFRVIMWFSSCLVIWFLWGWRLETEYIFLNLHGYQPFFPSIFCITLHIQYTWTPVIFLFRKKAFTAHSFAVNVSVVELCS